MGMLYDLAARYPEVRRVIEWVAVRSPRVLVPATYLYEIVVVLPTVYPPGTFWFVWHLLCATWLLCVGSLLMLAVLYADTSAARGAPSAEERYNFCNECRFSVAYRTWHCPTCRRCIDGRLHHCPIAGTCIGRSNQRFYLLALIYFSLGSWYLFYFNFEPIYLRRLYSFLKMTPKRFIWELHTLEMQFLWLINCLSVVINVLTIYQLWLFANGSTPYEARHDLRPLNTGLRHNIRCVFGKHWKYALFYPFVKFEPYTEPEMLLKEV